MADEPSSSAHASSGLDVSRLPSVVLVASPTENELFRALLSYFYFSSVAWLWVSLSVVFSLFMSRAISHSSADLQVTVVVVVAFAMLPAFLAIFGANDRAARARSAGPIRYRLSDHGVFWTERILDHDMPHRRSWREFMTTRETKECFIFASFTHIICLPKRCFNDDGDIDRLRAFLQRL